MRIFKKYIYANPQIIEAEGNELKCYFWKLMCAIEDVLWPVFMVLASFV